MHVGKRGLGKKRTEDSKGEGLFGLRRRAQKQKRSSVGLKDWLGGVYGVL